MTTTTTTTAATSGKYKAGDANEDGEADMSDVVAIMRWYANKADFPLTEQGLKNADVYGGGDGVTNADALTIQRKEAGLVDSLPVS